MNDRIPPLTPYSLRVLLGRVSKEWETRHRIFDLPTGRFFHSEPVIDLGVDVFGRHAGTPVGPAAGPHTQLAQNIVLGWLAGARVFELKTVQVLDELEIGRPCIDTETVGYNIEWSQELTLAQSLDEYVKAWMMLEILSHWQPLRPFLGNPGPHVFDMSVGYDLAGISSPQVDAFIRGLLDASAVIDRLREDIPGPFAGFIDYAFPTRLTDSVTLSTFHGCPPEEIEAISRHLIDGYGLDVTVKLNPTLLGHDEVAGVLGRLGYDEIRLDRAAFDADLQFERAIELIHGLREYAAARDRVFGIKLTNTLVVENHKGRLPDDPMYLSGPPLHAVTVALLERLAATLGDTLRLGERRHGVHVSFSGGIDRENFADAVGLGLSPITLCTDLLKPGGYGHFSQMLKRLLADMEEVGCTDIASWRAAAGVDARSAGHRDAVAGYAAAVAAAGPNSRYGTVITSKPLRRVDSTLELWDCVSCNLCITVCPNDAMIHLATPAGSGLTQKWQYLCLAELCNDCGNCTTFCPEEGDPFLAKPRLFLTREAFAADTGPAFLVTGNGTLDVEAAPDVVAAAPTLLAVLDGAEGLPLRAEDLGPER